MTRELSVPFAIDALGRVAFVEDPYQQITNHLVLLVGTRINERVMRPDYGVDTLSYLFAANDEVTLQQLTLDIEQAVAKNEPLVELRSVVPDTSDEDGLLGVTIYFSLQGIDASADDVRTAYVKTGGTVISTRG